MSAFVKYQNTDETLVPFLKKAEQALASYAGQGDLHGDVEDAWSAAQDLYRAAGLDGSGDPSSLDLEEVTSEVSHVLNKASGATAGLTKIASGVKAALDAQKALNDVKKVESAVTAIAAIGKLGGALGVVGGVLDVATLFAKSAPAQILDAIRHVSEQVAKLQASVTALRGEMFECFRQQSLEIKEQNYINILSDVWSVSEMLKPKIDTYMTATGSDKVAALEALAEQHGSVAEAMLDTIHQALVSGIGSDESLLHIVNDETHGSLDAVKNYGLTLLSFYQLIYQYRSIAEYHAFDAPAHADEKAYRQHALQRGAMLESQRRPQFEEVTTYVYAWIMRLNDPTIFRANLPEFLAQFARDSSVGGGAAMETARDQLFDQLAGFNSTKVYAVMLVDIGGLATGYVARRNLPRTRTLLVSGSYGHRLCVVGDGDRHIWSPATVWKDAAKVGLFVYYRDIETDASDPTRPFTLRIHDAGLRAKVQNLIDAMDPGTLLTHSHDLLNQDADHEMAAFRLGTQAGGPVVYRYQDSSNLDLVYTYVEAKEVADSVYNNQAAAPYYPSFYLDGELKDQGCVLHLVSRDAKVCWKMQVGFDASGERLVWEDSKVADESLETGRCLNVFFFG